MKMFRPHHRRGLSSLRLLAALLLFSAAGFSYFSSGRSSETVAPRTKNIEDVQVGDRVAGKNPIRSQAETAEPDPATWRKICLHLTKADGSALDVELLRPLKWLEAEGAEVGGTIFLSMAEMGAVGEADVLSIEPCPTIQAGSGTVVTGRFVHDAGGREVINVELENDDAPTTVTRNHPFWSVDRQEFVAAGELRPDEQVDVLGGVRRIKSITASEYRGKLYNLETLEHVYRAGSLGMLVHNACPVAAPVKAPGRLVQVSESMSDVAAKYQRQITGTPDGHAFFVDGVKFDGFKNGVLLEAKGLGYSKLIDDPYVAQKIADRMMSQATSQLRAASKSGTSVQWHVAEEDFAKGLRYLFRNLDGIDVIHTPIKH